MRTELLLSLGLVAAVLASGCGGPPPDPRAYRAETALRTAPLWMAEVDLPGCDAPVATDGLRELWLHPLDDQLVVVTCDGAPACVDLKQSLVTNVQNEEPDPLSQASATLVDDDPIPLVRERDSSSGGEGVEATGEEAREGEGNQETEDDPIPLVRLASGKPNDDPIPLVRERELKNVSTRQPELPRD